MQRRVLCPLPSHLTIKAPQEQWELWIFSRLEYIKLHQALFNVPPHAKLSTRQWRSVRDERKEDTRVICQKNNAESLLCHFWADDGSSLGVVMMVQTLPQHLPTTSLVCGLVNSKIPIGKELLLVCTFKNTIEILFKYEVVRCNDHQK